MPSAFHTFKLVPMAQNKDNSTILPPSTPRPSQPHQNLYPGDSQANSTTPTNFTPSVGSRMNPPPLPRNLITPAREMRESSVASSGSSTRKPRQNLDERDHLLMVKHCYEQREHYKEGTKAQFWTGVGNAFQRDTGKVLAQMSATVGRLVESRRRQIADWEAGITPQKPGGELNDLLDQWMEFLKAEDGEVETERMRQVVARKKLDDVRQEARRQTIPGEGINGPSHMENAREPQELHNTHQQTTPGSRTYAGSYPPTPEASQFPAPSQQQCGDLIVLNGHSIPPDLNGYRSQKRKRLNERSLPREFRVQVDPQQQKWHTQQIQPSHHSNQQYTLQMPHEPARKVIVEGQLTKEDWKEIMASDARLRALELKMERIETLVSQNNKLLLQLVQSRNKEAERRSEERVPVHLDAEFERDYL